MFGVMENISPNRYIPPICPPKNVCHIIELLLNLTLGNTKIETQCAFCHKVFTWLYQDLLYCDVEIGVSHKCLTLTNSQALEWNIGIVHIKYFILREL